MKRKSTRPVPKKMNETRKKTFNVAAKKQDQLELEFLPGLESFVTAELKSFGVHTASQTNKETLRFDYKGDVKRLFSLRRAVAVYQVLEFSVPRPKALLGDEHLRRLIQTIEEVRALHPNKVFTSFRLSAAGSDSPVFQRLAEVLSGRLNLPFDAKDGNLLFVVRPSVNGWEVAMRLTPRPLSARGWRVCNLEGGLNATLAVVINDLADVKATDRYLNAMCGSGTLLIELPKAARVVGVDLSERALECATQNITASGKTDMELLRTDTTVLPFSDNSFEVVTADVPWGDAVGTHAGNARLYPAFLREMARVTTALARLVVLTHELKLFEKVVTESVWKVKSQQRVFHGGHYPNIYVLNKK
jgi:tRNA (guanine6-N2)-methyltransferase